MLYNKEFILKRLKYIIKSLNVILSRLALKRYKRTFYILINYDYNNFKKNCRACFIKLLY